MFTTVRHSQAGAAAVGSALEAKLAGPLELPLLPRVAGAVLSLARDAAADARALAELVRQDQALAGHVLRVANSTAYGSRAPIVSLQQAIARLGMDTIARIALSASLKASVFRVPGHEVRIAHLWRHALSTAAWAREIARLRRRDVETAFLCGLLHHVGKPIVLQAAADTALDAGIEFTVAEMTELLDRHQARVGLRLAREWSLPEAVCDSIEFCEDYAYARRHRDEATTTHAADRLATHVLCPAGLHEEDLRGLAVFGELNLYPEQVGALLDQREANLELVEAMSL